MHVLGEKAYMEQHHHKNNEMIGRTKSFEDLATAFAHQCLSDVFDNADAMHFEKRTPLVFFSDCHRGDGGKTDMFACNEALYYQAMQYYANAGYTYVEIGDGDEMYKHPFREIQSAHGRVFDIFHQLDKKEKLMMITGNHDLGMTNNKKLDKGGLPSMEGVIISHADYDREIFVTHGHQADILSQSFRPFARNIVRYLVDPLIKAGLVAFDSFGEVCLINKKPLPAWLSAYIEFSQEKIEKRISSWVNMNQQNIICGHTHRFKALTEKFSFYYNTGSCLIPNLLTGFELINGTIKKVIWTIKRPARGGAPQVKRELISPISQEPCYGTL